jgi:hypothetical protein
MASKIVLLCCCMFWGVVLSACADTQSRGRIHARRMFQTPSQVTDETRRQREITWIVYFS